AIVTDVGRGMRWTLLVRKTSAPRKRTAKSCGPDIPTLISSGRQCLRIAACDGGNKARLTEEITKETVKTIARGMPGDTGVTVVTMLVCFFISHTRLRAQRAPGIPCALCFQRERSCTTRARWRREAVGVCPSSFRDDAAAARPGMRDDWLFDILSEAGGRYIGGGNSFISAAKCSFQNAAR